MEPFLKWPGGKRWLINRASDLFPNEENYNNYFEPFLGGGAVFFHLLPRQSLLSDLNPDLINVYRVIRDDWESLYNNLSIFNDRHCVEFYYKQRSSTPRTALSRASRFLYLNRTCWNGLYRVNKKGEFNVPIGTKTNVISVDDNFHALAQLFQNVQLEVCDFETTINRTNCNDFVFIDPPYTVKHNLNGFVKYNENIFSWNDQVRLRNSVLQACARGVKVLVMNADHQSIRELYAGVGEMVSLDRSSVIAGKPNARGIYSELAIKCW